MNTQLITVTSSQDDTGLAVIGQYANTIAARNLLQDYQARKTAETLRRQAADVALFVRFLASAGVLVDDLATNLASWSLVTWGLVEAFSRWQLQQGYAIGSINVRLATVKAYCDLAAKSGALPATELALIRTVKGFKRIEGRNQDKQRERAGTRTRREKSKKAEPVTFSPAHATLLKQQPATDKGRRDALILCFLLEHGLRVGEIAALNRSSLNLEAGTLVFYRHKVDKWQTHTLTPDTWQAARAYLATLEAATGEQDQDAALFTGPCSKERISTRTISARLATLGVKLGLTSLSPHDGRHYWATEAIRHGTDIKSLQDAGGWSTPIMPLRYAESSKIANAGVKLA